MILDSARPTRKVIIKEQLATDVEISPADLAKVAADAIDAKKGSEVVILDMSDLIGIVDLFVIATGASKRRISTMIEEVDQRLRGHGRRKLRIEGLDTCEWVLADYGDLAVHILMEDARRFYALERLWGDAPRIHWEPADTLNSQG
ncbi:MAG: ribosome silencing factor [Acidimicrobiia bacterium]|nr:ribosome silencing factor [Acidimicrobiia bacterium]MYF26792.1 ribosome silencing factor [Acidimicrobiia bacterium]MYH55220.1 ribosome silencing factor [Acidimicrobiia bacterium]